MPDFSNDTLRLEVRRLLMALGERYDGDPRIEFIDIGVVPMGSGTWEMQPI